MVECSLKLSIFIRYEHIIINIKIIILHSILFYKVCVNISTSYRILILQSADQLVKWLFCKQAYFLAIQDPMISAVYLVNTNVALNHWYWTVFSFIRLKRYSVLDSLVAILLVIYNYLYFYYYYQNYYMSWNTTMKLYAVKIRRPF